MKALILFCIFMLMTVACAPTREASLPASSTTEPTLVSPTVNSTYSSISPTEAINQPVTLSASETPTAATALNVSTKTDAPVTGAVQIAGGGCCIGGTEGDTIQVQVSFSAASLRGQVSQMRVVTGCSSSRGGRGRERVGVPARGWGEGRIETVNQSHAHEKIPRLGSGEPPGHPTIPATVVGMDPRFWSIPCRPPPVAGCRRIISYGFLPMGGPP